MNATTWDEILPENAWRARAARYYDHARTWTEKARYWRDCGEIHPVEDFLFTYYPFRFTVLETWHPGIGIGLEGAEIGCDFEPKFYRNQHNVTGIPRETLVGKTRDRLRWARDLLFATSQRAGNFRCFGLHEWAMVYQGVEVRHEKSLSLRLPQSEIDDLVRSQPITCSHFDAFRFFSPNAKPLNRLQPNLDSRILLEQPGCLHANMDLYKWAAKSVVWIGSELLWEAFSLALALRELDMRASPYDLQPWGLSPVKIETPEGRAEYERQQRALAQQAAELRHRLISAMNHALAEVP